MKTDAQVDAIMQAIPAKWRKRWCGGERGECACLGCVQIGNRAVIAEKILGEPYRGDPEYISEAKLQGHADVYAANKISREEWEAWCSRQGNANGSQGRGHASVFDSRRANVIGAVAGAAADGSYRGDGFSLVECRRGAQGSSDSARDRPEPGR